MHSRKIENKSNKVEIFRDFSHNGKKREYIAPSYLDKRYPSFQKIMRFPILLGQCFGLMPVLGVCENDISKLRFSYYSGRSLYTFMSIMGQALFALVWALKIIKQTNSSLSSTCSILFYIENCSITILFFKIAKKWPKLCHQIAKVEYIDPNIDEGLVKRCSLTVLCIWFLAILEHSLYDLSGVSLVMACQPEGSPYLNYLYHSFIWLWTVLPYNIFMVTVAKFIQVQIMFIWSYSDSFIMCCCWYLIARLRQVNDRINAVRGKHAPTSFWRTMREDYTKATELVRSIDDIVSGIVFVSFAINLVSVLLQILHVLEDGLKPKPECEGAITEGFLAAGYQHVAYYVYSIALLIMRALAICLIASQVHSASVEPAQALYDVPASAYCDEVQRFLDQIHSGSQYVALTGFRFFGVKRGIVLTIAGTIVTYELVLMQFADIKPASLDQEFAVNSDMNITYVKKKPKKSEFLYNFTQNGKRREFLAPPPFLDKEKHPTFQKTMRFTILLGQCFGLMPVLGIFAKDTSKLRFTFYSGRGVYTIMSITGQALFAFIMAINTVKGTYDSLSDKTTVLFYIEICATTILYLQIAKKWPRLCKRIARLESIDPNSDQHLERKCNITCIVGLIISIVNYLLRDASGLTLVIACKPQDHPYKVYLYNDFIGMWLFVPFNVFSAAVSKFIQWQVMFIWTYNDAFIICICWYLIARLRQVNDRICAVRGQHIPTTFWRTMREDYTKAADLVRSVDDVVSGIVFISFAVNFVAIILQILHVLESGLTVTPRCDVPIDDGTITGGYEHAAYFSFSIVVLIFRSLAVCLIASQINSASAESSYALYEVPSTAYCNEVQRLLDQIHSNREYIALSGLQFFGVKRKMTLTIAAAIVTYELVLLQFADVGPKVAGAATAACSNKTN